MTDATTALNAPKPRFSDAEVQAATEANRHTEAALERHKREGMDMAVKARWVALAVVGVMLPFLNPQIEMLYYEVLLVALGFVGWLQRRVGVVGRSQLEFFVMALDLLLMAFILIVPNPFASEQWPTAVNYRFGTFTYFYVVLAAGTLTYSWRTIMAMGHWVATIWLLGAVAVWYFGYRDPALGEAAQTAFGSDPQLLKLLDPNSVMFDIRVQELVVFVLVSLTLAMTVRRFNRLLIGNAELERERENLSRYFSPNVVAELSHNDEPLKQTRTHDVAVLFVDIVGFTRFSANRAPEDVIEVLRGFHARMEAEVFRFGGTLDKYLGDGLMATFGTPMPGETDAINALRCAQSMRATLAAWNAERRRLGQPEIQGSFGLHFGSVVLGDIGANRLEFAVIGNTVNVASRLEKLTRELSTELVLSDHLYQQAQEQGDVGETALEGLTRQAPREIRGLDEPVAVWSLSRLQ